MTTAQARNRVSISPDLVSIRALTGFHFGKMGNQIAQSGKPTGMKRRRSGGHQGYHLTCHCRESADYKGPPGLQVSLDDQKPFNTFFGRDRETKGNKLFDYLRETNPVAAVKCVCQDHAQATAFRSFHRSVRPRDQAAVRPATGHQTGHGQVRDPRHSAGDLVQISAAGSQARVG